MIRRVRHRLRTSSALPTSGGSARTRAAGSASIASHRLRSGHGIDDRLCRPYGYVGELRVGTESTAPAGCGRTLGRTGWSQPARRVVRTPDVADGNADLGRRGGRADDEFTIADL